MNTSRLDQLLGLLRDSPNDPFILYALAKEYEGLENKEEAKNYYQRLCQNHPDYVGTYYHYGKLQEKEEEYEEALSIYSKGMEIAKKIGDQHAHGELANAKLNLEFELD